MDKLHLKENEKCPTQLASLPVPSTSTEACQVI